MKKTRIALFFALFGLFLISCDNAADSGGETTSENNTTTEEGTSPEEEAPKKVNYEDDFGTIKTHILRGQKDELAGYTQLSDNQSVDELLSLFDDTFSELFENTAYSDLGDTEIDGKQLKELNLTATFGEEGEDTMESALIVYLEAQEAGLRIVQYLVAG